jgi:hypothetical protein
MATVIRDERQLFDYLLDLLDLDEGQPLFAVPLSHIAHQPLSLFSGVGESA